MSTDTNPETSKQQPKPVRPDALTKTPRKGDIELTEEQLEKAGGGCCDGRHLSNAT